MYFITIVNKVDDFQLDETPFVVLVSPSIHELCKNLVWMSYSTYTLQMKILYFRIFYKCKNDFYK